MNEIAIDYVQVGKFIRKLRIENNMSQVELGNKLYISTKSVSKWETGRTIPSIDMLKRLSALFGVSIEEIIRGDIRVSPVKKVRDFKKIRSIMAKCFKFFIIVSLGLLYFFRGTHTPVNIYSEQTFVSGDISISNENNLINFGDLNVYDLVTWIVLFYIGFFGKDK